MCYQPQALARSFVEFAKELNDNVKLTNVSTDR